ncbi:hypothetical protein B0H13DRAFT_1911490 [Mycena leptocephala]|nr:hypothetical protein B0H13DRAFT_1911490 [Mycena leptocephala]
MSSRTHRLRRGTAIFATGFVVTQVQMEAMSRGACDDAFLANHGRDLVFALKWRASLHDYELLPLRDPQSGDHLLAVHFFPCPKDATSSDIFIRHSSLLDEQKNAWYDTFGKHTDVELKDYEIMTIRYPTNGAAAHFLPEKLQEVSNADRDLQKLLEPIAARRIVAAPVAPISALSGGKQSRRIAIAGGREDDGRRERRNQMQVLLLSGS